MCKLFQDERQLQAVSQFSWRLQVLVCFKDGSLRKLNSRGPSSYCVGICSLLASIHVFSTQKYTRLNNFSTNLSIKPIVDGFRLCKPENFVTTVLIVFASHVLPITPPMCEKMWRVSTPRSDNIFTSLLSFFLLAFVYEQTTRCEDSVCDGCMVFAVTLVFPSNLETQMKNVRHQQKAC